MNIDQLIELGRTNPELANMVQEFDRLRDLAIDEGVKNWLGKMVEGLIRQADPEKMKLEAVPFLKPYGGVKDDTITVIETPGGPTSIWSLESFHYRLQFLMTGRLAISHFGPVTPIAPRMDFEAMGIKFEKR